MSFEVMVIAADDAVSRPRSSDVLKAFEGHILQRPGVYDDLVIGSDEGPRCEVSADWGSDSDPDPEQWSISINEPLPAPWLWEGVLDLLRRFDVFMMVPDVPTAWGAYARADATIPDDLRSSSGLVQVASAEDLIEAFRSPPDAPLA